MNATKSIEKHGFVKLAMFVSKINQLKLIPINKFKNPKEQGKICVISN